MGLQASIEPNCLNIFHHKSALTHAFVGNLWNLRNPVRLSKQTALQAVSENDVWHTGSGKRLFVSQLNVDR